MVYEGEGEVRDRHGFMPVNVDTKPQLPSKIGLCVVQMHFTRIILNTTGGLREREREREREYKSVNCRINERETEIA